MFGFTYRNSEKSHTHFRMEIRYNTTLYSPVWFIILNIPQFEHKVFHFNVWNWFTESDGNSVMILTFYNQWYSHINLTSQYPQLTGWFSSSGREILPEDCVVDVTSTIKLQCRAQADDCAYTVWNKCKISRQLNLEEATKLWSQVLLGTTK